MAKTAIAPRASRAAQPRQMPLQMKEQVGFLLRKAYQRNMTIFQNLCPDRKLTAMQAAALVSLIDIGPCSLSALGSRAAMDPATTRGVVDRLLERKLVSLSTDRIDRRKVIVKIKPSGRKLIDEMLPVFDRIADDTMAQLNSAERVVLVTLLQKVGYGDEEGA
jgi:DNA-binding MarR family transcriptional regulator